MSKTNQLNASPRASNWVWMLAGCAVVFVVFACIMVVAVGGYFYFQDAALARATPTWIAVFVPSTPTRAPITLAPPPTLALPTIAPVPTPKCPPPPALPVGVLFGDDFGSRQVSECNGWTLATGENVDHTWSANKFTLTIKKKLWLGLNWPTGEYDNFGVETEAQPVGDDYAEYGLSFRIAGAENSRSYYFLGVTTDGKYFMYKRIAGNWSDVDPVKVSFTPAVKPGKNKNLIGVIAQGNTFALYINRVLVNTITDDSLAGKGAVGVIAGTGENNTNTAVAFSRLTILTPDKARVEWGSALSSTQPGAPSFSAVTFSSGFDEKTWTPIEPGRTFPFGVKAIYAYWTYANVAPNTNFEYEWQFNGARIDGDRDSFGATSGKSAQWLVHPRSEAYPLDRGSYQFSVRVGGQVVISDTFVIQ